MRKQSRDRYMILGALQAAAVSCATADAETARNDNEQSTELAIVDQERWRAYPASDDPLPDHQPETIRCNSAGVYLTPLSIRPELEIETAYCNYPLLYSEALRSVARGAQVSFEVRHFELLSDQPAHAHVALFFDQTLTWETYIDIPSEPEVTLYSWRTEQELQVGAPVRLHLHNHGQNTWLIGKLTTVQTR